MQKLGGSDEAESLLEEEVAATAAAEPSLWKPLDEALPELELTDLEGKTWRREDFLGGRTRGGKGIACYFLPENFPRSAASVRL